MNQVFRCAALSVAKHDYVARGVITHPRFELAVVADDADVPEWMHERNQQFADSQQVPYVRGVERALSEFNVQVAIVSSEAERHCDLSIRAALAGKHVIQDKPMSTCLSECDRLVAAIQQAAVRFLMWNRNGLPSIQQAQRQIAAGTIGQPLSIHVDFYFAKDAGPPRAHDSRAIPPWTGTLIRLRHTSMVLMGGLDEPRWGNWPSKGFTPSATSRC